MKEYPQHPEWSSNYPAIDGIAKSPQNFDKSDRGDIIYTPEQKPIRSDIEKILLMNSSDFIGWLSQRREATKAMLKQYELFASIPNLNYSSEEQKLDMTAFTHVKSHLSSLNEGLDYLEKIEQLYHEIHKE